MCRRCLGGFAFDGELDIGRELNHDEIYAKQSGFRLPFPPIRIAGLNINRDEISITNFNARSNIPTTENDEILFCCCGSHG